MTATEPVLPFDAVTSMPATSALQPMRFDFRIDAKGRPLGIRRVEPERYFYSPVDDASPALAATRFVAGQVHPRCAVTYEGTATPLASASVNQLADFLSIPHQDRYNDPAAWRALRPAGTDCQNPRPRNVLFPDFTGIPGRPGIPDHGVAAYDIDAEGKPVNVRVLGSSGNDAFDREALRSIEQSRFASEPKTGCLGRFGAGPRAPMLPPEVSRADFSDGKACRKEPAWETKPVPVFPTNFTRRSIEGIAIIGFDVAPWGGTGNVRVLASEPSFEFGDAARNSIERAKKPPSERGLSGCVQVVRFAMGRASEFLPGAEPEPVPGN